MHNVLIIYGYNHQEHWPSTRSIIVTLKVPDLDLCLYTLQLVPFDFDNYYSSGSLLDLLLNGIASISPYLEIHDVCT